MERRTQEIRLADGETMLAAVTVLDTESRGFGEGHGDADGAAGGHRADHGTDHGGGYAYDDHGAIPEARSGTGYPYRDTGALDALGTRVQGLNDLVRGVGSAVLEAARATRPDEVSATFGVEFAVKSGRAVAMLADGEAKGSISVTLTWRTDGGVGEGAPRGT